MPGTSISDLPAELLVRITDHLPIGDIKILCRLNTQFHKFLVPTLFKNLRANNRETDASPLEQVVAKYGRHVETLCFYCYLEPNWEEDGSQQNDDSNPRTQPGFSQIAQDLLAGQHLSGLKTVSITFEARDNFNTTEDGDWGGARDFGDGSSIYIHERLESDEERIADEKKYAWRADLNLAFKCLSRNPSLNKLEIHNFIPKAVSAFYEPEWPAFLAKLLDFEFHMWAGDNGAGWQSNTLDGYTDFIACLPELIFQHLRSVKQLVFAAEADNPIGCVGQGHAPIPLPVDSLPDLRDLTIKNCYVDPALQSFLESKAQQLRSLRLVDCLSAANLQDGWSLAENAVTWAEFFRNVREADPVLRRLDISNHAIDLVGYHETEEGRAKEAAILSEVESSGGRRKIFVYATQDEKYGIVMQNEESNVTEFQDGVDQKEYDALIGLVDKNEEGSVRVAAGAL